MLIRFDPFRELDRLVQPAAVQTPTRMPLDAYRHGSQFVIHFDLPGIDPESVGLTVEKNVLTVTAERTWTHDKGDEVVAAERPHGRYSRQLLLGDNLATDGIDARYDRGVLTVTIPVVESAKPRKIHVASAEQPESVEAGSPSAN